MKDPEKHDDDCPVRQNQCGVNMYLGCECHLQEVWFSKIANERDLNECLDSLWLLAIKHQASRGSRLGTGKELFRYEARNVLQRLLSRRDSRNVNTEE